MTAENKKILMVVAPTGFKDEEFFIIKEIFEKEKAVVQLASMASGAATSGLGKTIKIDFAVDEVKPDQFDAIVFVGGHGMVKMTDEESFVDLARDFFDKGKLTCAICIAPVILANAGILSGKAATVHESGQTEFEEAGVKYTGDQVTKTDNIITASNPLASGAFAKEIIKALA